MDRPLEHHIQRSIIVRLSLAETLRFSDLKPASLENNHFMYHLNRLIKDGLVEKRDNLYALAPAGLTYVDLLSYKNRRPRHQPKLIAILVVQNKNGDYLLAQRHVQPYYGYAMLPSGKQHFGESPFEHAAREAKEKTGLAIKLAHRGYVNVKISKGDHIISHVAAHVFSGKLNDQGAIKQGDERFKLFWQPKNELDKVKLMPGTLEIIELVSKNQTTFFESLEYQLA
ncbi:MAG TPA: NUDIX domain-containing protein [Candidatus Saccharimonadales bacterium]|nr:NUDIX domain-containing protein [Candidatus Saccharimonadales bacterium]